MRRENNLFWCHFLLLVIETGSLIAMGLVLLVWPLHNHVVHRSIWQITVAMSIGIGTLVSFIILCRNKIDFGLKSPVKVGIIISGLLFLSAGGMLVRRTFPEVTLQSCVQGEDERFATFGCVPVVLDADGGLCDDLQRIVKFGESYGRTQNLYPAEDYRRMRMHNAKIDLIEGVIHADFNDWRDESVYIDYCTSNAVPVAALKGKWTYVIDMDEIEGKFFEWVVGQTAPVSWGICTQLSYGRINPAIKSGDKKFLVLNSSKTAEKCNMLDRAYIHLKPGQHLKAKFRVSLFAGTGVNESNYHYVKPGETIACKLPVPTRKGYVFEGWYDGDKRVTEETKVEKREAHTLKARWRKR